MFQFRICSSKSEARMVVTAIVSSGQPYSQTWNFRLRHERRRHERASGIGRLVGSAIPIGEIREYKRSRTTRQNMEDVSGALKDTAPCMLASADAAYP